MGLGPIHDVAAAPGVSDDPDADGAPGFDTLHQLVVKMGGLCERQLGDALEALIRRDSALAEQVMAGDRAIDALEQEAERIVLDLLTGHRPPASQLRLALSVLKIVGDLERVGDLSKNVAKRSLVLNKAEPVRLPGGIGHLGREALLQLNRVLDAFDGQNTERALEVWHSDKGLDELYNSLFRELLAYMADDPRTIGVCTHLLFVAKNFERLGDHATNIAETVYYIVSGAHVAGERPKGDTTSLTRISFDGSS